MPRLSIPNRDIVLGGGPAGLFSAYYLTQADRDFLLFEASSEVGGAARTCKWKNFSYDTGAHRWHNVYSDLTSDLKSILRDDFLEVRAPSQICFDGRTLNFPLELSNLLTTLSKTEVARAILDFLSAKLSFNRQDSSFEMMARRKYGRYLAEKFLISYSEKLWGAKAYELIPEISGKRLNGLNLRNFFLSGECTSSENLDGSFYYPKTGIGAIANSIFENVPPHAIKLNSPIDSIYHESNFVFGVSCTGDESIYSGTNFLSTLPLPLTVHLMKPSPPDEVLEAARSLKFRNILIIFLALNKNQVSKNASIYLPSKNTPITRIVEPKNRSEAMAPMGMTSLACELPCFEGDQFWKMEEKELLKFASEELVRLNLIKSTDFLDGAITRIPNAYPVLTRKSEENIQKISLYFEEFSNLSLLGRSSSFAYLHMHELMRDAKNYVSKYRKKRMVADQISEEVSLLF